MKYYIKKKLIIVIKMKIIFNYLKKKYNKIK
jgi:hypothetical protein